MRHEANRMLADIEKALDKWNERSAFTLKRVGNLSRSDLDTLQLYASYLIQYGTYKGLLMEPRGGVRDVLQAYGILIK